MEQAIEQVREKVNKNNLVATDFYKIAIVGGSGKGKSYSFRNMDEKSTGFVNVENKPLPFKRNFKYNGRPKNRAGVMKCVKDYSENPEITCMVIDSFSAVMDIILEEVRRRYSGFDIWSNYNKHVGEFIKEIKQITKEVFVSAHYEILNPEGEAEKRIKTKGNEWAGMIEKEFTMVLYAENKFTNGKPSYIFRTVGEGLSAKCPPGIFGEDVMEIDNDANEVLKAVRKFSN